MTTQEEQAAPEDIRTHVRERYGKAAARFQVETTSCCGETSSAEVQQESSSCCGDSTTPEQIDHLSKIYETADAADLPEEVTGLSMGCGDPITLAKLQPGQTVLDLGSGGGIDCFLAAKNVGPNGHVIGVDMTPEMLEKARANKIKVGAENVEFRLGEIENLPVADDTVDVIISNCVINLSPDKPQVFREAYRALRPGGYMAVSDIVTDGPLPDVIKKSVSAWAGCIAGAMDVNDYLAAIEAAGFTDVQLTPVYFDDSMVDDAATQLGLDIPKDGKRRLIINADTDPEVIEIDEDIDLDGGSLKKAIFSAKITAYKPV
jgi:SAM-dependent methyltransferase